MNEKKPSKSIVISSKPGQLGNMLFLFSHFIAFGIEKNILIKAPAFEEYAGYFDTTRKALIPSYPKVNSAIRSKWLRKFFYSLNSIIAKIIFRLKLNNRFVSSIFMNWTESLNLENEESLKRFNSRYIFIQGWLYCSDTYIQKHKKAITDFFKPADFHLDRINKLMQSDHEVIIGIHIRQGDYKIFEGGKYFFDMNQYLSFMRRVLTLFPSKKFLFLICSNSHLKHEDFTGLPYILGTGREIEDLYAFSKCNYLVGPPSTFTMWASFYGNVPLYEVHHPDKAFSLADFKVVEG